MDCFYHGIFLIFLNLNSNTLKVEGGSVTVVWHWKAKIRGLISKSSIEDCEFKLGLLCHWEFTFYLKSSDDRTWGVCISFETLQAP